jgi:uncharacterized membrane protein
MWKSISQGRLFGHPIHPMLVHFPTALFLTGFLFDAGGLLLDKSQLFSGSFYVILLGLAAGLPAVLFGLIDYVKLSKQPELFRIATWHAGIQFVVLVVFGIIGGLKYQAYPDMISPGMLEMGIMGGALAMMLVGNYLGGEMVFTYKVGIDEDR